MSGKVNAKSFADGQHAQTAEIKSVMESAGSTSSKIRSLAALGLDRSTIANITGKRYQHVRNVLVTKLASKGEA